MRTPLEYATCSDAPYKLATFLLVVKLQDAWEKFKMHGLATCFYVYVLVPVVSGAPHFPVMVRPERNRESQAVDRTARSLARAARQSSGASLLPSGAGPCMVPSAAPPRAPQAGAKQGRR